MGAVWAADVLNSGQGKTTGAIPGLQGGKTASESQTVKTEFPAEVTTANACTALVTTAEAGTAVVGTSAPAAAEPVQKAL